MEQILIKIVQMSGKASIVIAAVLLVRLAMKRFPKKYTYMLWFVVGFRLLCPFDFQSDFSVFNLTPIKKVVDTSSITARDYAVSQAANTIDPRRSWLKAPIEAVTRGELSGGLSNQQILAMIWFVGFVGIAGITVYKYAKALRQLRNARKLEKGIYESERISAPFVIGVRNPKIYLPVDVSESEREYLILHEQVHVRYGDYFVKCVGFFATAIHWFNPLVWLAYLLYSKDVEMRCDEVVIDKLGYRIKKDYSLSLVSYASKRENMTYVVMPLNFSNKGLGGMEVKMRIKNILSYKKASKLVAAFAIVLVGTVTIYCASNAKEENPVTAERTVTEGNAVAEENTVAGGNAVTEVNAVTEENTVAEGNAVTENVSETEERDVYAVLVENGDEILDRYTAKMVIDEKTGEGRVEYMKIINEQKGEYEVLSTDSLDPDLKTYLDQFIEPADIWIVNTDNEKNAVEEYREKAKEEGYFVEDTNWSFVDCDHKCHNYKGIFVTDTKDGNNTIVEYVVALNEEEFELYLEEMKNYYTFQKTDNGYRAAGTNGMQVTYEIEYHADEHILVEFYDTKSCTAEG